MIIPRAERGPSRSASVDNIIARQPWDTLVPHILSSGADVENALPRLKQFARLAIEWNRSVSNLISRNDEGRIVTRHLRESIEPARWLKESGATRWLDFGSGAGFPAIPLAILGVGESWTLVESRRPKTLFMRRAIQELELTGIEVFHGRLEQLIQERGSSAEFDGFTSRATMRLSPTLKLAESVVRTGGTAFLWKGSRRDEEIEESSVWSSAWNLAGMLTIGDEHTAVAMFNKK